MNELVQRCFLCRIHLFSCAAPPGAWFTTNILLCACMVYMRCCACCTVLAVLVDATWCERERRMDYFEHVIPCVLKHIVVASFLRSMQYNA